MPVLEYQRRNLPKRSDEGRKAGLGIGLTLGTLVILVIVIYFIYKITNSSHSKKRSKKKPKIHTTTVNGHEHIHIYEPGSSSSSKSKSKSKSKKDRGCGCHGRCQCSRGPGKHSSGQRHGRRATTAFLAEGYEWVPKPTPAPDSGQLFAADDSLPPPLPCVGQPMFGPDPLLTEPFVTGESQHMGARENRYKLSLLGYLKNKHCCKKEGSGCCDNCCKRRTRKCREHRSTRARESDVQLEGWIEEDGTLYVQQPAEAQAPVQDTVVEC